MSASLDFPALDFSPVASTSALPSDHNSATSDSASAPATAVDPPAEATPKSWSELGVSPFLVKAMAAMSIRHPTAVQQACIPPILAGKSTTTATLLTGRVLTVVWVVWFGCAGSDCIGSAQTGSGKTIAFALPIMQQLAKDPYGLFAVVLTPTRYVTVTVTVTHTSTDLLLTLIYLCHTASSRSRSLSSFVYLELRSTCTRP